LKYLAAMPIVNGLGERAQFDDPAWPRYIRTTDIGGPTVLRADTFVSLPPATAALAPVVRGDVLMSAAGTIGRTYLHTSDEPACFAGYLVRFRPRSEVDPRFISYWTQSTPFLDQVSVGAVRSTIDYFSAGKYQNLLIDVPSLAAQRAIADYLDAEISKIDALMAARRSQRDLLRLRLRAAIDEQLDTVTEAWRLRHVLAGPLEYGASEVATENDPSWPRYVRITDIDDEGLLRDETFKSLPPAVAAGYMLDDGDLLLTRSGATVGKSMLWRRAWGPACFAGYLIRARPNRSLVLPEYLAYVLRSSRYWDEIRLTTIQATIPNVSAERYGELRVPLPTVDRQRDIVSRIDVASHLVRTVGAAMDAQMGVLAERRRSVITAAVTGQLDVPGVAA
jgi:type I restriction enzyme S subunit